MTQAELDQFNKDYKENYFDKIDHINLVDEFGTVIKTYSKKDFDEAYDQYEQESLKREVWFEPISIQGENLGIKL